MRMCKIHGICKHKIGSLQWTIVQDDLEFKELGDIETELEKNWVMKQ
jgi:hypothetical protein